MLGMWATVATSIVGVFFKGPKGGSEAGKLAWNTAVSAKFSFDSLKNSIRDFFDKRKKNSAEVHGRF